MFSDLEGQLNSVLKECTELAYFMRGAIPYDSFMKMTPKEKKVVSKFLNKRLKDESEKIHPVY